MNTYSIEHIKKLLDKIYEKYGLDTNDMSDAEIDRMCEYYYNNQNILKKDLLKSKVICDEDALADKDL